MPVYVAKAFTFVYNQSITLITLKTTVTTMKVKHLFVMSMLATVGCNPAQQNIYDSLDDYPVYKGDWEEMVYTPSATRLTRVVSP